MNHILWLWHHLILYVISTANRSPQSMVMSNDNQHTNKILVMQYYIIRCAAVMMSNVYVPQRLKA